MSLPIIYKRTVPLSRVHKNEGDTIVYADDFGDSWRHEVLLEAILPVHADRTYPLCVAGVRARPPDDVGGAGGYVHFLAAIGDPAHAEHDALLTWAGGVFDPEGCDVNTINRQLRWVR